MPAIKDYFSGISAIVGQKYKLGVYSDGVVCDALLTASIVSYAWLSASSSFDGTADFYKSGRWTLCQQVPTDQNFNGLSVDLNQAKGDVGAFVVPFTGV